MGVERSVVVVVVQLGQGPMPACCWQSPSLHCDCYFAQRRDEKECLWLLRVECSSGTQETGYLLEFVKRYDPVEQLFENLVPCLVVVLVESGKEESQGNNGGKEQGTTCTTIAVLPPGLSARADRRSSVESR